jgi:hapalindole biogenesis HpiC1 cyclase-like protein
VIVPVSGLRDTLVVSGLNFTERGHLHRGASSPCACLAVFLATFLAPSAVLANPIEINTLLTDPSLETLTNGCPTSWICSGSPGFGIYSPTASQYTPGADGLPGLTSVPDQTLVSDGSGTMYQTTSAVWQADTTYTFTFFLGTPATLPDGTTPVIGPPTGAIRLYFLEGRVQAGMPAYDLQAPAPGQWETLQFVVTPQQIWEAVAAGQKIGIMFFISPNSYFEAANIDIDPPPAVPEPATFALVLPAIAALWLARRSQCAE